MNRMNLYLYERITQPLNKNTARAISMFYGNIAHIVILRCARNTCWRAWHSEEQGVERIQAELGWRVLEHVITKLIDRIAEKLVEDSHA